MTKKEEVICQDCLITSSSTFKVDNFHWVVVGSLSKYQGLFCSKCITKFNLEPIHPYKKKTKK